MPIIRPISDLRNNANAISEQCHSSQEPIFITKNGTGDLVIMGMETYELMEAKLELYAKLAEAEAEIAAGSQGEDFAEVASQLRSMVHGNI